MTWEIIESTSNIWSILWNIGNIFQSIWTAFEHVAQLFMNFVSYVVSILWFIWYAWKTLILWVYRLLVYIFDNWVFINLQRAFLFISDYIWNQATVFLFALLFVAIVRVIVAFVFKILRLNLDYNTLQRETTRNNLDISRKRFNLFRH